MATKMKNESILQLVSDLISMTLKIFENFTKSWKKVGFRHIIRFPSVFPSVIRDYLSFPLRATHARIPVLTHGTSHSLSLPNKASCL